MLWPPCWTRGDLEDGDNEQEDGRLVPGSLMTSRSHQASLALPASRLSLSEKETFNLCKLFLFVLLLLYATKSTP